MSTINLHPSDIKLNPSRNVRINEALSASWNEDPSGAAAKIQSETDTPLCQHVLKIKDSIEAEGQLQPISVSMDGDEYVLNMGLRRLVACALLGREVRAEVTHEFESDYEAYCASFAENEARADNSLSEKLAALSRVLKTEKKQAAAAKRLGVSAPTVSNWKRVQSHVPEDIIASVDNGDIRESNVIDASRISSIYKVPKGADAETKERISNELATAMNSLLTKHGGKPRAQFRKVVDELLEKAGVKKKDKTDDKDPRKRFAMTPKAVEEFLLRIREEDSCTVSDFPSWGDLMSQFGIEGEDHTSLVRAAIEYVLSGFFGEVDTDGEIALLSPVEVSLDGSVPTPVHLNSTDLWPEPEKPEEPEGDDDGGSEDGD